ncbi:MAG: hypothetical protein WBG42_11040, partial [Cryomorphaceae bacterium]
LMALITTLLGMDSFLPASGSQDMTEFMSSVLYDSTNRGLFYSGIALTAGIPAVALILLGVRMLFQRIRYAGIVAIFLIVGWFTGIGLLAASGIHLFEDRKAEAQFTETLKMDVDSSIDTLVLDIEDGELSRFKFSGDFIDGSIFFEGGVTIPWIDSTNLMYVGKNSITIRQASGDRFLLEVEKSARGSSQKDAIRNARQMKSSWLISTDSLKVSPYFTLEKGSKIRGQEAEYTLYVPVGKAVNLAPRSKDIIYNIPNVTNTYDWDMVGKTWLMTEKGLKCTTCRETSEAWIEEELIIDEEAIMNEEVIEEEAASENDRELN